MSHIPSAAMPHAKPHEASLPVPITAKRNASIIDGLPIGALAIGGVLALGGVVTAALLWRRGGSTPAVRKVPSKSPAPRAKRRASAKPTTRRRAAKTAPTTPA